MDRSLSVAVALALAGFSSLGSSFPLGAQDLRCSGFQTQAGAQAAFDAYPERAAALDTDGDGQACEGHFDVESGDNSVASTTMEFVIGPDVDCVDLETQEDAQLILDSDPADPFGLDPNGDGVACALLPSVGSLGDGDESEVLDPVAGRAKRAKDARVQTSGVKVVASCDGAESWASESLLRLKRFWQISDTQSDMNFYLEHDAYSRQFAFSDELAEMAEQQRTMVVPTSLLFANNLLADAFDLHSVAMYSAGLGVAALDDDVVKIGGEKAAEGFDLLEQARIAAYDACNVEI